MHICAESFYAMSKAGGHSRDFGCGTLLRLSSGGAASTHLFVRAADHPRDIVEHAYPSNSIVFTDAGEWQYHGVAAPCTVGADSVVVGASAGRYECLHPPGIPGQCFIVAVDGEATSDLPQLFFAPVIARSPEMLLHRRALEDAAGDPERTESLAFSLLDFAAQCSTGNGLHRARDVRMDYATRLMRERCGRSTTVAEIARALDLSRFTFTRRFRAHAGMSPYAFISGKRIERAKRALRRSSLSIEEIALANGFGSLAHFSNTFRRVVGSTPSSFRRDVLR